MLERVVIRNRMVTNIQTNANVIFRVLDRKSDQVIDY